MKAPVAIYCSYCGKKTSNLITKVCLDFPQLNTSERIEFEHSGCSDCIRKIIETCAIEDGLSGFDIN